MSFHAEQIVDEIIRDLEGRNGLGDEWDGIDALVQSEIRDMWVAIADRVLTL